MRHNLGWIIVAAACALVPRGAAGLDPQMAALQGLRGVYIVADPQGEKAALEGIAARTLESDIGARLSGAGVKVYTAEELKKAPGSPFLYLRLGMVRRKDGRTYVYNIALQLEQMTTLVRKPDATMFSVTWQSGGAVGLAGATDRIEQVRRAVREQVDQFLMSYRTANPGR